MIADPHEIQRLRFMPGQDLLARDFRDGETFETRLRHWHNRALHGVYGVASGLRVEQQDTVAAVEPGLAYDATGRELILPSPRTVPYPVPIGGSLFLVLRPGPGGAAELVWAREERPCDGVPLARVSDVDGVPEFRPPLARPLARPHIGYGSTIAGGTAWQAEILSRYTYNILLLALRVEVDTRAAGFTELPCYFAWLQGGLPIDPPDDPPVLLHPALEKARTTGFELRILTAIPLLVSNLPNDEQLETIRKRVLAAAQQKLSLGWLGIRMQRATQSPSEVNDGNP